MEKKITEKEIEKYLIDRVKEFNGKTYKFTSPTSAGVPDRIVIFNSGVFFVELKTPNGRLSPRQIQCLRDFSGGIKNVHPCWGYFNLPRCAVLSNYAEVDDWLRLLFNPPYSLFPECLLREREGCLCNPKYMKQLLRYTGEMYHVDI